MYIETVRNRNSPPAILLREGGREGKKVRKRTLANLSHLPKNIIELIRRALKGEAFVAVSEAFEVIKSSLHGHVNACRTTMRRLRFDKLLASKPCRERNLVEAMVAARILEPDSKLATTRWWHTTTLPESLGVADANEDDLYAAMDWLLERQERIEKKLAGRHLKKGGLVLYDLSSSYFEGVTCPLAAMGYSRDGKRDRLQVNYGLVTDERGCPVAVSVFAGNESDSTTLMPQVEMVRNRFGIKTLVLVGDRGMISQKQIDDDLRNLEGVDWITALKSASIRKLIDGGQLQLGLFDERNLFELTHPDFAGERLFACRNTELAKLRVHKRQSLLQATARELARIQTMVQRARLRGKDKIGARVRKVVTKTLAKYFVIDIRDDDFTFQIPNKEVESPGELKQRMMTAAQELSRKVGVRAACEALEVSPATFYRRRQSSSASKPSSGRASSPRALAPKERQTVHDTLNSERFVDQAPTEVYATLLDAGKYLCSVRTMYRILEEHAELRERRDQLRHPNYEKPVLLATGPNQVWSWDITKLLGPMKWVYFHLYVILDIFSRYVVGWMLAERESAELAKRLIKETCSKQGIVAEQLTLHADRGTSMKSKPLAMLLSDLGVTKTHSRPQVSNDNPYSESQFKTLKYRPEFPKRFGSIQHARDVCSGSSKSKSNLT